MGFLFGHEYAKAKFKKDTCFGNFDGDNTKLAHCRDCSVAVECYNLTHRKKG